MDGRGVGRDVSLEREEEEVDEAEEGCPFPAVPGEYKLLEDEVEELDEERGGLTEDNEAVEVGTVALVRGVVWRTEEEVAEVRGVLEAEWEERVLVVEVTREEEVVEEGKMWEEVVELGDELADPPVANRVPEVKSFAVK